MNFDRASMGLDRGLDRPSLDEPRWASTEASMGLDKSFDRASMGRWASIAPRWPSIASLGLDGPQ